MAVDKKISYEVQGGAKNYLGKQKQVTAPLKWKSSPDSPETELAYITKAEKDLLVKKDLHGSLKGGVNRGPSGIMSLDGYGSFDDPSDTGKDTGMSGAATSAAESGRNTRDTIAEGASYRDVQDYRDAAIASGAGQRVNPGFFDSRNVVSPDELSRARQANPAAFKATRGGGLMNLLTGGGFLGNIVRGLGQKFGLGKTFDQPTYDMSRFSGLPLGGSATFQNLDIRDKFDRRFQNVLPSTTIDEFGYSDDFLSSLVDEYGVKDRGLTVAPGDGLPAVAMADRDMGNPQEVVQKIVDKVESGQTLTNDEQLIFDNNIALIAGKSF
jgi:hypothetical protein